MGVLTLENVSSGYDGQPIVQQVSLSVAPGELVSLIGPNGAGKTTLFHVISGRLPLMEGRISFANQDISRWSPAKRTKLGIARSYQTTNLFPTLTVLENVELARAGRLGVRPTHLFSRRQKSVSTFAYGVLEQVELADEALKPARLLSHGDKRKLELALVLSQEPQILLVDEPTAGMASIEVPDMFELIQSLQARHGFGVLLVEHKMDVVMSISSRVVVLQQGRLIADGSPTEIVGNEHVQSAYLGGAYGAS